MSRPILLPQNHHVDAGPLELARQFRPVRLDPPPRARGAIGRAREQPLLQRVVCEVFRQRPGEPRRGAAFQIVLDRAARHAEPSPDLARAHPLMGEPQHLPKLSHGQFSLGRHSVLLIDLDGRNEAVTDLRAA